MTAPDPATQGFEALARADWQEARSALASALANGDESPEVLDALGRALWWLRDAGSAVVQKGSGESFIDRDGDAIDRTVLHMLPHPGHEHVAFADESSALSGMGKRNRKIDYGSQFFIERVAIGEMAGDPVDEVDSLCVVRHIHNSWEQLSSNLSRNKRICLLL